MTRFNVYANPTGSGYVLDVQADVLGDLNTRLVAPLMPLERAPVPAKRLNPIFQIGTEQHVMVTQFMATIPRGLLRDPVTNLAGHDAEISNALDMLFVGF